MSYARLNKRKYHFIYKTTCSLTGRYYIGMHSTDNLDDGYLGSGRRLRHSIRKYGPENHVREILEFCSSREELASREAEIVNLNEIAKEECMNISFGGYGGIQNEEHMKVFSRAGNDKLKELRKDDKYLNIVKENIRQSIKNRKFNIEYRKMLSETQKKTWIGRKHKEETKRKIGQANSLKQTGSGNSQYGTMWITDGKENKKIKKEDKIPNGWSKGRKTNKFYMNNGLVERLFTRDQLEINLSNGWNIGRLPDKNVR